MPTASTSFFGWVAFLLQKYGTLFLRGTGMTLLIALTGTLLGFLIGLLVAIVRTVALPQSRHPQKSTAAERASLALRRALLRAACKLLDRTGFVAPPPGRLPVLAFFFLFFHI